MNESTPQRYTAFNGQQLLATGLLEEVALSVKDRLKVSKLEPIRIFGDLTGKEMDLDLRGSEAEILQRLHVFISPAESAQVSAGPGRPRLGVVAREVSLLPRHWEWLPPSLEVPQRYCASLPMRRKKIRQA